MVTREDKAYFARIADQNRSLREEPPASLQEALDRMQKIADRLGRLAENPGTNSDGDLKSHLSYLRRLRSLDPDYDTTRSSRTA